MFHLPESYYLKKLLKLRELLHTKECMTFLKTCNLTPEHINYAAFSPTSVFYNTYIPQLSVENYDLDFFKNKNNLFFIDPENRGVSYHDIIQNDKKTIPMKIFEDILKYTKKEIITDKTKPANINILGFKNTKEINNVNYKQFNFDANKKNRFQLQISNNIIDVDIFFPPTIARVRVFKHIMHVKKELKLNNIVMTKIFNASCDDIHSVINSIKEKSSEYIYIEYINSRNRLPMHIKFYVSDNILWMENSIGEKKICKTLSVIDDDIVIIKSKLNGKIIEPDKVKMIYDKRENIEKNVVVFR